MTILMLYLSAGLVAGFLAGLLGIGGGLVLVPVLVVLFTMQGFAEPAIMPLALGTSLATIIFTSVSSMRAHHANGAVDWRMLRWLEPGIVGGAIFSTTLATHLPSGALKIIFAVYAGLATAGGMMGGVSVLAGVSGASTAIPFLLWCNVPMRVAIGTASAIGLPVAVSGTLGYVVHGFAAAGLPRWSFGFVHLPALAAIVVGTVFAAQLGARASYRLPVPLLRKALAAALYIVALRSLLASM